MSIMTTKYPYYDSYIPFKSPLERTICESKNIYHKHYFDMIAKTIPEGTVAQILYQAHDKITLQELEYAVRLTGSNFINFKAHLAGELSQVISVPSYLFYIPSLRLLNLEDSRFIEAHWVIT